MSGSSIRVLVAVFLLTWIASVIVGANDSTYQVSERIANSNWAVFEITSIVGIGLLFVSTISLLFLTKWSRWLFLVYLGYWLTYGWVYGSGSGNALLSFLTNLHLLSGGAIVAATFSDPMNVRFSTRNRREG